LTLPLLSGKTEVQCKNSAGVLQNEMEEAWFFIISLGSKIMSVEVKCEGIFQLQYASKV